MIVKRLWFNYSRKSFHIYYETWEGFYLFGFIPLYLRMIKLVEKY